MFAYLLVALLNGSPLEAPESTCRAALAHLHQNVPALRRIVQPLVFDLRIAPRIVPGTTRPALENMAGIVDGLEYDFTYPVRFAHGFHPLPGVTRMSQHEVWFDTRWLAPDGDFTHAHAWTEERTYWLDVAPLPPVALLRCRTVHFSFELPDSGPGMAALPYPQEWMWKEQEDPGQKKYRAAQALWKKESAARYLERELNPRKISRIEKWTLRKEESGCCPARR